MEHGILPWQKILSVRFRKDLKRHRYLPIDTVCHVKNKLRTYPLLKLDLNHSIRKTQKILHFCNTVSPFYM
jgi:hypothetical protein